MGRMAKEKKAKLANAPKKPRTTYITFSMECREKYSEDFKMLKTFKEQAAFIKKWDNISKEDKSRLQEDFDAENALYKEALAKYMESELYIQDCEAVGIKPKKAKSPSAYNLFMASEYKKSGSNDLKENSQRIGELWANMTDDEKAPWKLKAEE